MVTFLTDSIDLKRIHLSSKLNLDQKSELGQFLTPAPIARFIAAQFTHLSGHLRLLDPGAGVGSLTAAFTERLLQNPASIKSCFFTAYEIEPKFISPLEECLSDCCTALEKQGISASYHLHQKSFVATAPKVNLPIFANSHQQFTHAILNPPYRKIKNQSLEGQILPALGIEATNLYSAFVWIAMLQLVEGGEIAAITPRSFCNGAYFRPFRAAFLQAMRLNSIHIFEERSSTFADDRVLQENIIFHAFRSLEKSKLVKISSSAEESLDESLKIRLSAYDQVVKVNDREQFIHIVPDASEDTVKVQMEALPSSLEDLGLAVSTGRVVDFRLKSFLSHKQDHESMPLLYPESIKIGSLRFPPANPRKPIGIKRHPETERWLIQSGWYVVVKRFSAKEEKRRVVAAVCPPISTPVFGIENHLNYYHAQGEGIDADLARGLTAFLNSTLCDRYFRQFSGHTQVNATDLRQIRYPHRNNLMQLGRRVRNLPFDQNQLDQLIYEILPLMSATVNSLEAGKRILEAIAILKSISAPKEQQNERSALCLLALADIRPEAYWNEATAPRRGITEMMDWFRRFYGKQYAPNTRETVRRQTMHQFVQMGLIVENPDQPDRPINSPKWCYQLHQPALLLLQAYGSEQWENEQQHYAASVSNRLKAKNRNLSLIPVSLPDGRAIQLSSGGQNELIKAILESFCPRFTPGGIVLYVGDAGEKFIVNETQKLQEIGLELNPHGKMPDLVIHYQRQGWLVLVEAVTSHGPVNLKRRNELKQLFQASNLGLVFVTAFPSRKQMTRYLAEISWETEVWVADQPDHMIHFNGERFLGPYEDSTNF
jgi:adenine-specific DNA-methyltransferase